MRIENIDLVTNNLNDYKSIVDECKEIINENLYINGGTLRQADIFDRGYKWTNLIVARNSNGEIMGFLLVRASLNMHGLKDSDEYYYISDIVVKNKYKRQGVGTELLKTAMASRGVFPVVASVLQDNAPSIGLLSKQMTCYGKSDSGMYLRFVDKESYLNLYGAPDDELKM